MLSNFPRMMLVDMNSFFASVEQQANPFLRGRPLGVSPSHHPGSCLIGTSREAKALGIKNGTPLYKARKICPKIIVIESEPEKYREVNRQINKIFLDYTERVEAYSVDESFLDFRDNNAPDADAPPPLNLRGGALAKGQRGSYLNLLEIAAEIKRRIRQEVGEWLTCSVGIAPNKFMCKLAADMEKPDGLSILWQSQLPEIYKTKKLSDLWGINHGWTKRLEKLGIISPLQLLDYPVANLIAVFGKPGYWLWQRVNGFEFDIVDNNSSQPPLILRGGAEPLGVSQQFPPLKLRGGASDEALAGELLIKNNPKSFGHSWVLNFRTTEKEQLKIAVLRLAEKAARRMRAKGFVASGMYLSITLIDGVYFRRSKKLKFQIETGLELYQEAVDVWKSWQFRKPAMHIAVGFTHLQTKTIQLSLFPDKFLTLTKVLDGLNNKYGEFTIRSGLLAQTRDYAPDAIAFGR